MEHYSQLILNGKFSRFDYGSEQNMKVYNSSDPLEYNLQDISVPVSLFWAKNDNLADTTVIRLIIRV